MENFIYVFSEEACQRLKALQYQLVHSDFEKSIFVFVNEGQQKFSLEDFNYVLSDTLVF